MLIAFINILNSNLSLYFMGSLFHNLNKFRRLFCFYNTVFIWWHFFIILFQSILSLIYCFTICILFLFFMINPLLLRVFSWFINFLFIFLLLPEVSFYLLRLLLIFILEVISFSAIWRKFNVFIISIFRSFLLFLLNRFSFKHIEIYWVRLAIGYSPYLDELALSILGFMNAEELRLIFNVFMLESIEWHHFPTCIHKKIILIVFVIHREELPHEIRDLHFRVYIILKSGTISLYSLYENSHTL